MVNGYGSDHDQGSYPLDVKPLYLEYTAADGTLHPADDRSTAT